ncbi:hypothetical protein GCM10011581_02160 [Saccharopolyspora subtropica]|uniref:Uncharacterized protein n=1 Tax=Saccharopolyspora thermophila TaxID=89367 RepID=A0A917JHY1_9PSEU|nr:hypothetical protein [Saccharopolyspora subtropica]GGI68730.1 hypothetical protein GCM10011581_02160 [Saccharopolyspora subtropica]
MTEQTPASVRYREITGLADAATERMRRHETERVRELGEVVAAARQRREEAEKKRDEVVEFVLQEWKEAVKGLWDERWFQVRGKPTPNRATTAQVDEAVEVVKEARAALQTALEKPRFSVSFRPRRRK